MMLVDYAFPPHPSTAALRAAGVTGVSRYLSYRTASAAPKVITPGEYAALRAAGFDIVLNWEFDARDYRAGATGGADHAHEAVNQARALGYPAGCAIIGSADTDMPHGDWLTYARPYYRAFAGVLRAAGYRAGIYGPWDVLTWARDDGVADTFWQAGMSTAWSAGRNRNLWPGAHLRQRRQLTIGGADCDISDIIQSDYGQQGAADVGSIESQINADANAWAVRTGADAPVYPNGQPGNMVTPGNPLWDLLRRLDANVAADLAEDNATAAALKALVDQIKAAGGSVDAAPILAAIAEVKAAESATVTALQQQITDLTHRLAAAAQASAGALDGS